jgi:hypothetical protein
MSDEVNLSENERLIAEWGCVPENAAWREALRERYQNPDAVLERVSESLPDFNVRWVVASVERSAAIERLCRDANTRKENATPGTLKWEALVLYKLRKLDAKKTPEKKRPYVEMLGELRKALTEDNGARSVPFGVLLEDDPLTAFETFSENGRTFRGVQIVEKDHRLLLNGSPCDFDGPKRWAVVKLLTETTDPDGWAVIPGGSKALACFKGNKYAERFREMIEPASMGSGNSEKKFRIRISS